MRKVLLFFLSLLMVLHLPAQSVGKQQLIKIFNEAEQCYLMDDYQQLKSCLDDYSNVFQRNRINLGDSIDVYTAYFYKMCGTFYYGLSGDYSYASDSERYYRMSLDIFSQRNNVPNALTLREELAQLYYKMKDYERAKVQLDSVYNYYDERLHGMGVESIMPNYYKTITQLAMCNARLGFYNLALDQINEAINDYYKRRKNIDYFESLRKRGKILMLQADSLGSTQYKKAVDSYQQYVNERYASISKEISSMNDSQRNQYWLATHQFLYDCYRLGNHAPEMLYDLALFSKDYLVRRNATPTKWKRVKQSLGKKDCAIEFVQYFGKNDEKRIGCLVLKSNSKRPLFVDLFSTDSLLNLSLTNIHTIGSAITSSLTSLKDTLYNDKRLLETIWTKPLMTAIGDAHKVYFAPDGLLHQLAIEYLMPDTTKVCYRLTSTRVLTKERNEIKMENALLCGGIEYGASYQPSNRDNDVIAYRFLATQTTTIKDLLWAKKEVDTIYSLRHHPNDTLLVGSAATDESFLKLLKQHYDVIHISTHGYFGGRIGIYNDIKPLLDDESMSKSGLLFAGAANTLTDKSFDENLFDGVLSASELSKQNLSSSELIILSACQTGLGHLTDDGIYGIQHGLKLAGANAVVLSLWSVNDYSSSVLMRFFYEEIENQPSKDIHTAFLKARKRLMQEEKTFYKFDESTFTIKQETERYNTPRHINPYIIIDAL